MSERRRRTIIPAISPVAATAAITGGSFKAIERVTKVDSHAIRLHFAKPTPFWADAFVTIGIIPKHLFADYTIAKLMSLDVDGQPCFHPVGSIETALTQERMDYLVRRSEFAESWGFQARIISAAEAAALGLAGKVKGFVDAVNQVGATPSALIAILEALKRAGSLRAELVVL